MKKFDKFIRLLLAIFGESFDLLAVIVKYILGLLWTGYSAIRGKNFKKVFDHLNYHASEDLKWIFDEIRFYI